MNKPSIVYFTMDLSPEGLHKVYSRIKENMTGKIAIKLHTGEKNGPNIIPSSWVKKFMAGEKELTHIMRGTVTQQSSTGRPLR